MDGRRVDSAAVVVVDVDACGEDGRMAALIEIINCMYLCMVGRWRMKGK